MNSVPAPRVVVFGGSGFYGRYLARDLLMHTGAEIVLASRNPDQAAAELGVRGFGCDLRERASVQAAAEGAAVIVHAAGPFMSLPLAPLEVAIDRGVDYVDIAEDRGFVAEVRSREAAIASGGGSVLTGASVSPSMEALIGRALGPRFDRLESIRTFAAPDTARHRGAAMFETMLWGVGREFELPRGGAPAVVHGWTEPEWVELPPPFGRRLTYLVHDMANVDLLPELLGVQTLEFRAGCEQAWLNRLLGAAGRVRRRFGAPHWERFSPAVRAFGELIGRFGRDEGGVVFELSGIVGGEPATYRFAITVPVDSGRVPVVLAGLAVEELLAGRLAGRGLMAVDSWIAAERLVDGLLGRGMSLWWRSKGDWEPFDPGSIPSTG